MQRGHTVQNTCQRDTLPASRSRQPRASKANNSVFRVHTSSPFLPSKPAPGSTSQHSLWPVYSCYNTNFSKQRLLLSETLIIQDTFWMESEPSPKHPYADLPVISVWYPQEVLEALGSRGAPSGDCRTLAPPLLPPHHCEVSGPRVPYTWCHGALWCHRPKQQVRQPGTNHSYPVRQGKLPFTECSFQVLSMVAET